MDDLNPLSAVTAPDPYPYYDRLTAHRPFDWDASLGMWIAASAAAVEAVLSDADLRVRPMSEPVPSAIAGTPLGALFARLARMTDGPAHAIAKRTIVATLEALVSTGRPQRANGVRACSPSRFRRMIRPR